MLHERLRATVTSGIGRALRTPESGGGNVDVASVLADVRRGARTMVVVILGDSTTTGLGAGDDGWVSNARAHRPATRLAHHLTVAGTPASAESQFGSDGVCPEQGVTLSFYNPTISYDPAVWDVTGEGNSLGGSHWLCTSGFGSSFAVQPQHRADTFKWFVDERTLPAARFTIDGRALWPPPGISTAGNGIAQVTTRTPAAGMHRAEVARDAGAVGPLRLLGVVASDSEAPDVVVISAGNSGRGAGNLAASATALDARLTVQSLRPDLAFINIGLNDMVSGVAPDHWRHLVGLLMDTVSLTGQVVVVMPPQRLEVGDEVYLAYRETALKLAQERDSAFLDLGSLVGPYAEASRAGWYRDSVHMTPEGYDAVALAYAATMLAL